MTRALPLTIALAFAAVSAAREPIAQDVAHWRAALAADTVTVGFLAQVKDAVGPALASADQALAKGRRSVALLRLANVRSNLAAGFATKANATDADLDAARARLAPRFTAKAIATAAVVNASSALGRAFAQSSAMQAKETFDASLVYGKATEPLYGLYYVNQGVAWLDYAAFSARALPAHGTAPKLRSFAPEIRALRNEMLAAYRPPLSIDRHPEFIGASSATKEALEYDRAGYREAALLRYLQAAVRFAPLRAGMHPLESSKLAQAMGAWRRRLAEPGQDHSIGTLFLEVAEGDADTARAGHAVTATAVVEEVLPRYFAALEPTRIHDVERLPELTVTLVRWPYT